jgi:hypothetical protein
MWLDIFANHPAQHRCAAIGRITSQLFRLEIPTRLEAFEQRRLGNFNFRRAVGRRSLDIQDGAMGGIDQIICRVGNERVVSIFLRTFGLAVLTR